MHVRWPGRWPGRWRLLSPLASGTGVSAELPAAAAGMAPFINQSITLPCRLSKPSKATFSLVPSGYFSGSPRPFLLGQAWFLQPHPVERLTASSPSVTQSIKKIHITTVPWRLTTPLSALLI